jgi:hypothetical protein
MDNEIELDGVDALGAGAIGEPGPAGLTSRPTSRARLTVVVEKEQVALLGGGDRAFLGSISLDYPEEPAESAMLHPSAAQVTEPAVPLFARMIGLGSSRTASSCCWRERADDERRRGRRARVPLGGRSLLEEGQWPHLRHEGTGSGGDPKVRKP